MENKFRYFFSHSIEAFIWLPGIVLLAMYNPADGCHFSLCLFKNLGLTFCPGCGIGHSIAWFFRGELQQSFQAHPFGIPALLLLFYRIFVVFSNSIKLIKLNLT